MKVTPLETPFRRGRQLLTVRQVAEMLNVCERTVFSLTHPRGPLPAVRIGRRVLYDPRDVEQFVRKCKSPENAGRDLL